MKIIPPVLVEVKPSKIISGEIGLFAARDIRAGTIIGSHEYIKEDFYPWSIFETLDEKTQEKVMNYCVGTEEGFYAPEDFNYLPSIWQMNHSCDGNVAFDKDDNFITIRDVIAGDELCWDYGLTETNPRFKMECHCGSSRCRKTITGNDWKFLRLQPDKAKYMSKELMEKEND